MRCKVSLDEPCYVTPEPKSIAPHQPRLTNQSLRNAQHQLNGSSLLHFHSTSPTGGCVFKSKICGLVVLSSNPYHKFYVRVMCKLDIFWETIKSGEDWYKYGITPFISASSIQYSLHWPELHRCISSVSAFQIIKLLKIKVNLKVFVFLFV